MMKGWTEIHTTTDPFEAELIRGLFKESKINAIILNQKDSSYGFGVIAIMIQEEEKQKAQDILDQSFEG